MQIIQWAIPSGGIGAAIAWVANRKVKKALTSSRLQGASMSFFTSSMVRYLEPLLMWMWCCMRSASRADGIAFDYGFDETCDLLTPDAVASWNAALAEEDKKKE